MYWGKKEAAEVGPKIRDKYKDFAKTSDSLGDDMDKAGSRTPGILKNPTGKDRSLGRSGKRGGSRKKKRNGSPGESFSPDESGRMTDKMFEYKDKDGADGLGEEGESLAKPKFSYQNLKKSKQRSRSKSGKAS